MFAIFKRAAGFCADLAAKAALGFGIGVIVMFLPLPEDVDPLWQMLQSPLGALVIVCSIGKALYDTLFYDRYRP